MANQESSAVKLTRKDFVSNQEVRWCPGCGDYAILAAVQKILPQLEIPREKFVFVSGIGCSSRFPYYMNTFGFHGIHGRAPSIATGIKSQNPDLSVWVMTGDGDALSIGGNHFIHTLRRNVDLKIILFNNRIYGLTKGQYSPTSEQGKITKTSPMGTIDYPINPITVSLGAEATFVARGIDTDVKNLEGVLLAAARHIGSAFVEIIQNCVIYNDGGFGDVSDRSKRSEATLVMEEGKPLIFGANHDKGIRMKGWQPEVVTIGKDGITENDIMIHDPRTKGRAYANILGALEAPEFPVPIGIFRQIERPSYDQLLEDQIEQAKRMPGESNINKFIASTKTWTISEEEGR